MSDIRDSFFPPTASAACGVLSIWEKALGLPVAPADLTEQQRRDKVMGMVRRARSGQGIGWVERLSAAVGSGSWSHEENTPGGYQLTITLPFAPASFQGGVVQAIARRLTPANLQLIFASDEGFIVGESVVGEPI